MKLFLPFIPPSVNQMFYTDFSHRTRHKSKEYKAFIENCKDHIQPMAILFGKMEGDLSMEINLYFPTKRKNDIDNRIKPILDTLTHYGVWGDDSQVVRLVVEKRYQKNKPETWIEINPYKV